MKDITYISDQPADYAKEIRKAIDLKSLQLVVTTYRKIAEDAYNIVIKMTNEEWPEFQRGLKSESKGKFAGEEWTKKYRSIIMPEIMFKVSIMACRHNVPWGLAYLQMEKANALPS